MKQNNGGWMMPLAMNLQLAEKPFPVRVLNGSMSVWGNDLVECSDSTFNSSRKAQANCLKSDFVQPGFVSTVYTVSHKS